MIQHNAAVHLPLALAVIIPVFQIVLLFLVKVEYLPWRSWVLLCGLSAMQFVSAGLAFVTGQKDMPFSSASHDLLMAHRKLALIFVILSAGIVIVHVGQLFLRSAKVKGLTLVLAGIFLVSELVIAIRLGHIGGQILQGL